MDDFHALGNSQSVQTTLFEYWKRLHMQAYSNYLSEMSQFYNQNISSNNQKRSFNQNMSCNSASEQQTEQINKLFQNLSGLHTSTLQAMIFQHLREEMQKNAVSQHSLGINVIQNYMNLFPQAIAPICSIVSQANTNWIAHPNTGITTTTSSTCTIKSM